MSFSTWSDEPCVSTPQDVVCGSKTSEGQGSCESTTVVSGTTNANCEWVNSACQKKSIFCLVPDVDSVHD
jgi:hypothetical protein